MVKTGTCWVIPILSYKPVYQTWSIIGCLHYLFLLRCQMLSSCEILVTCVCVYMCVCVMQDPTDCIYQYKFDTFKSYIDKASTSRSSMFVHS